MNEAASVVFCLKATSGVVGVLVGLWSTGFVILHTNLEKLHASNEQLQLDNVDLNTRLANLKEQYTGCLNRNEEIDKINSKTSCEQIGEEVHKMNAEKLKLETTSDYYRDHWVSDKDGLTDVKVNLAKEEAEKRKCQEHLDEMKENLVGCQRDKDGCHADHKWWHNVWVMVIMVIFLMVIILLVYNHRRMEGTCKELVIGLMGYLRQATKEDNVEPRAAALPKPNNPAQEVEHAEEEEDEKKREEEGRGVGNHGDVGAIGGTPRDVAAPRRHPGTERFIKKGIQETIGRVG